jgi:heme exporter protein D
VWVVKLAGLNPFEWLLGLGPALLGLLACYGTLFAIGGDRIEESAYVALAMALTFASLIWAWRQVVSDRERLVPNDEIQRSS